MRLTIFKGMFEGGGTGSQLTILTIYGPFFPIVGNSFASY